MNLFEAARRKYRPDLVRVALIAESPPQEGSGRFFYFENVSEKDALFLEIMRALYVDSSTEAKTLRQRKPEFLRRFRDDGFYLLDASQVPIAGEKKAAVKRKFIREGLDQLQRDMAEVQHVELKVVLISSLVYEICLVPLRQAGFKVINTEMIDFPGSWGRQKFRTKFGRIIERI